MDTKRRICIMKDDNFMNISVYSELKSKVAYALFHIEQSDLVETESVLMDLFKYLHDLEGDEIATCMTIDV